MLLSIASIATSITVSAVSFFVSVIRTFIVQIVIGCIVGLIIMSFGSGAHASVSLYQDPIAMQYGTDYTSWDVICFYGRDVWKIILLMSIPVIAIAVAWIMCPRDQYTGQKG